MGVKVGKDGSVAIGARNVGSVTSWSVQDGKTDILVSDSFGSSWKEFLAGMRDGHTINVSGHYRTDDIGQQSLIVAHAMSTYLTKLRLYCDKKNYMTTDNGYAVVTGYNVKMDKSAIANVSFTMRISGQIKYAERYEMGWYTWLFSRDDVLWEG